MLTDDLRRALDPLEFASDAGLPDLDDWQRDLLVQEPERALVMCSRQSGKSTTTSILALHEALYNAPALILLVAPALRQAQELFRKVMESYNALPDGPKVSQQSALRVEFDNGSRIISLPGSEETVRGYSAASLVVVDEAARVTDSLLAAITPMLAVSQGKLIALTTPRGKRGWFYDAWTNGRGWHRTRVTAYDCPRISNDFLENERRMLGELQFRQEYMCEFIDDNSQVFPTELIEGAFSDDVKPLFA